MSILDHTFAVIGHGAFSEVKLGRKEDGTFFGKQLYSQSLRHL